MTQQAPKIHKTKVVAKSHLFTVEALDLEFSNGEKRTYERMQPSGRHAVMCVPINNKNELILVKEYCAGTNSYEIGFPKGLIDPGESADTAANRELKEEIGMGANQLTPLKEVILAPSYFSGMMTLFLAQHLYEEQLEGDEPEPLELIYWPLAKAESLISSTEFTESRSITALLAMRQLNL